MNPCVTIFVDNDELSGQAVACWSAKFLAMTKIEVKCYLMVQSSRAEMVRRGTAILGALFSNSYALRCA